MHSFKYLRNLSMCTCVAALCATLGAFADPVDINGSFELVREGNYAQWNAHTVNGLGWQGVDEGTRDGANAVRVQTAGIDGKYPLKLWSNPIDVNTGDAIACTAWLKIAEYKFASFRVSVEYYLNESWSDPQPLRPVGGADGQWRQLGVQGLIVPHGATQVRVVAIAQVDPEFDVDATLDDIELSIDSLTNYVAEHKQSDPLKNIFWAGVDTCRPEILGAYSDRVLTPTIDEIAAEGRVYHKATTAAPWTKPSFASMFTSLYPSQHGAEEVMTPLSEDIETIAEYMKSKGYFTIGFAHSTPDGYLGSNHGHAQGFDVWCEILDTDQLHEQILTYLDLNADALSNLEGGGIFVFYHMYEPHWDFVNYWPDLLRNQGKLGQIDFGKDELDQMMANRNSFNEKDFEYIEDVYAWGAIFTDERLGAVLSRFKWTGVYDDLNILINSDHGTAHPGEFPDLDPVSHGNTHEVCVNVPMILRFPGAVEPGEHDKETFVSTLDIMPTLLELTGQAIPEGLEGQSMLDEEANGPTRQIAISEGRRAGWLSLRDGKYKLIVRDASDAVEENEGQNRRAQLHEWNIAREDSRAKYMLFDLEEDPDELNDISSEDPETLERLKTILMAHCERTGLLTGSNMQVQEVSDETLDQLEALGYVE